MVVWNSSTHNLIVWKLGVPGVWTFCLMSWKPQAIENIRKFPWKPWIPADFMPFQALRYFSKYGAWTESEWQSRWHLRTKISGANNKIGIENGSLLNYYWYHMPIEGNTYRPLLVAKIPVSEEKCLRWAQHEAIIQLFLCINNETWE